MRTVCRTRHVPRPRDSMTFAPHDVAKSHDGVLFISDIITKVFILDRTRLGLRRIMVPAAWIVLSRCVESRCSPGYYAPLSQLYQRNVLIVELRPMGQTREIKNDSGLGVSNKRRAGYEPCSPQELIATSVIRWSKRPHDSPFTHRPVPLCSCLTCTTTIYTTHRDLCTISTDRRGLT